MRSHSSDKSFSLLVLQCQFQSAVCPAAPVAYRRRLIPWATAACSAEHCALPPCPVPQRCHTPLLSFPGRQQRKVLMTVTITMGS